jgi:hypothetical protein
MKRKKIDIAKLRCDQVVNYVCDDIEVSRSSPVCRQIREHLANCPDCSKYVQSLRKTVKLYQTYEVTVPHDLHERVMQSLKKTVLSKP